MRHSAVSPVIALFLTLAACSGDDDAASQTPVARNFDELARAVAGCADTLKDCSGDDAGPSTATACRDAFIQCRTQAGKAAEDALVDEISDCQQRANECRDDASTDAIKSGCAETLRACIGDARSDSQADASRDAGGPNPNAPTYQCFGQLRECVTGGAGPQKCAAEARTCVIGAVGDPPVIRRPRVVPPSDAGVRNPQAGSTAAGAGGAAGAHPIAGTGGAAGSPHAGSGGAGAAGSGDDEAARMCMAEYDACVAGGAKPMMCAKAQRKCTKEGSGG